MNQEDLKQKFQDWSVFRLAWVLQPDANFSCTFWSFRVSLRNYYR